MKKTILITGAGGLIGTILRDALTDTYSIRSLSLQPIPDADTIVADITDLDAMLAACEGVESIIHLAANASHTAPWDQILPTNIIGTYNVYEAAAQKGVKQVIFASSNHAVGAQEMASAPAIYHQGTPLLDHLTPARPDGYYGVSKSFGETLGRYYADYRNLRVICLRIGWVNAWDRPVKGIPHDPDRVYREWPERLTAIWLSKRDLLQLVEKSLEAEHVQYDIFYGISNNQPHFYDLEHAREIVGYVPQDGGLVAEVYQSKTESS